MTRLTRRFLLAFVLPLTVASLLVIYISSRSMEANTARLEAALQMQANTERALSTILIQEDATKALLLDPDRLGELSQKKLKAYDEHKAMLAAAREGQEDPDLIALLDEIEAFDKATLRPIDTQILEALFMDPEEAVEIYTWDYEPARTQYQAKVEFLAWLVRGEVSVANQDAAANTREALLQISAVLLLAILLIVSAVLILGRRADKSAHETRALLGGMQQGLLYFTPTGALSGSRSQSLDTLLVGHKKQRDLASFMERFAGMDPETTAFILESLWPAPEDTFYSSFEDCVELLPKLAKLGEGEGARCLEFRYTPCMDGDTLKRVYVNVRDITQTQLQERAAREMRQRLDRFALAAKDLRACGSFIEESSGLLERAEVALRQLPDEEALLELQRALHAFKGAVATYGFQSLAADTHEVESELAESGAVAPGSWTALCRRWERESTDLKELLGLELANSQETVNAQAMPALLDALRHSPDCALKRATQAALRLPLPVLFQRYENEAGRVARKKGLPAPRVVFAADNAQISHLEIQGMDRALVQLIRNAVDHGLEPAEDREAAGKAPFGTLRVHLERSAHSLTLRLSDDGRGVDAERLAERALEQGFWSKETFDSATSEEKLELLFRAGLTTKRKVSQVSGRGMGMDLVRAALQEKGGDITFTTRPGRGSCFTITLADPSSTESIAA